MSSAALFRTPVKPNRCKHLYQFKAGKMNIDDSKWVVADTRKGYAYVYQSSDSKVHFCWIDRESGMVENNYTLDNDSKFEKIEKCKDGRVFSLKTKSGRFFIWMQETNSNNDSKICNKINGYISTPPSFESAGQTDILAGLNNLSENDILTLLSMGVGLNDTPLSGLSDLPDRATTSATKSGASAGKRGNNGKIQLDELRNIISTMSQDKANFNDILCSDTLKNIVSKDEYKDSIKPFLPKLPVDDQSMDTVKESFSDPMTHINSSQFKSTLQAVTSAFQTGQLSPVLQQFNLGSNVMEAANSKDISKFAKAMEDNENLSSSKKSRSVPKDKDSAKKDDGMDTS